MAQSKIEWTQKVWNPVTGCTKISDGCTNCYAEKMAKRLKGRFGYPEEDPFTPTFHPDRLTEPISWIKPKMVFVCSMGDLFHEEISFQLTNAVFSAMADANQHIYQVLTKRPERMKEFFDIKSNMHGIKWQPSPNVWLGVSAENQEQADKRIPILLQVPAAVRFVSCEPLLGLVNLTPYLSPPTGEMSAGQRGLNWIIAGGESGHKARPMHPDWATSLRDQCKEASVPFFFKQWGAWWPNCQGCGSFLDDFDPLPKTYVTNDYMFYKIGKKHSGRILDGKEHNEYPEIQSFNHSRI